ncbi:hypothetical protein [Streptomyces sp. HD]|uniref:hypothetical protein n=1 Tax=Streptomyces sp. HD TaxID=3020892 RepID=UPI00232D2B22|nr:hypothetical protein [Streptomyces sp. HD]MDC0766555.1 hypothetical protein [Streptomyces sp. HD]
MPAHATWTPRGASRWRGFVSGTRAILVMVLMLCAVIHGATEQTHASVSMPAVSSAVAAGGGHGDRHGPHGPRDPHEAEDCAADAIVRNAFPYAEDPPLDAMDVVVPAAGALAAGRPPVRRESRRRRSARTGRVALVRTSRWRI